MSMLVPAAYGRRMSFALPWTGEVLIGRSDTCHIVVGNPAVSRVHSRINIIRGEAARHSGDLEAARPQSLSKFFCRQNVIWIGDERQECKTRNKGS